MKKGESECQYYIEKLEYLDDRQRDPRFEQCKSLLCHGELRNKSGTVSKPLPSHQPLLLQAHMNNKARIPNKVVRPAFLIYTPNYDLRTSV